MKRYSMLQVKTPVQITYWQNDEVYERIKTGIGFLNQKLS